MLHRYSASVRTMSGRNSKGMERRGGGGRERYEWQEGPNEGGGGKEGGEGGW